MANKYLKELLEKHHVNVSDKDEENIKKWNELIDTKDLDYWSNDDVNIESNYLKAELVKHKPVNIYEMLSLIPVNDFADKIFFYNGDMASVFIDALAIPVSEKREGSNNKQHCVYYYNGINLLKKLNVFTQGKKLEKGEVVITRSYNIPSDFIIHVKYDYKDIAKSILNILECSRVNMVKSVLIDIDMNDISLYKIVYDTICEYLETYSDMFDRILIYVNETINVRELEKELS